MPTRSAFGTGSAFAPALPRIWRSTAGAILQPHPPPWLNWVRRSGLKSGAFIDFQLKARIARFRRAKSGRKASGAACILPPCAATGGRHENHAFLVEIGRNVRTPFLRRGLGVASRGNAA